MARLTETLNNANIRRALLRRLREQSNVRLLGNTKVLNIFKDDIQGGCWPHSGYVSPETMVTCLSILTRLELLFIEFESPQSRPDQKSRRPPPLTRALLPVLTELRFRGVSEYFEDLVARVDTPLLGVLAINFHHQLIFETPQLTQFISRTPKFKLEPEAHKGARVVFSQYSCVRSYSTSTAI